MLNDDSIWVHPTLCDPIFYSIYIRKISFSVDGSLFHRNRHIPRIPSTLKQKIQHFVLIVSHQIPVVNGIVTTALVDL